MCSVKLMVIFALCALQISTAEFVGLRTSFPPVGPRIVGGVNATEGQAPFQCSLQRSKNHFCGCAVLNEEWILTAGHCVSGSRPGSFKILVGTIDLKAGGELYNAENVFVHENYFQPSYANDIALIRVKGNISFSENVQPISLYPHEVQENSSLQLTGWGRLSAHGGIPNILQVINLNSVTYETCRESVVGKHVHIGHLCTLNKAGEGACNGDSGGPLTYNGQLVGLVNFGSPCARGVPDAFAKISYYNDWIETTIKTAQ